MNVTPSHNKAPRRNGFTIIEVLITTFIIGTVVTGLFGLFVLSLRTAQESERRLVAVALANERMEMIRNLPYVDVGTAGGVPSGTIAQSEVVERNGVNYTVNTDIRYVDDPYDGTTDGTTEDEDRVTICHQTESGEITITVGGPSLDAHLAHGDTTGACGSGGGEGSPPGDEFNSDYKQVRVEVVWQSHSSSRPVLLLTLVAPQGIEGSDVGGTLDFQAMNAAGLGIEGATVTIFNDQVSPVIDITTQTNSEGRVVLPGLPESAENYKVTLSYAGYTSEQTYDQTADFVPNADYTHLSMIAKEITAKTFFIDQISTLNILTQDEEAAPIGSIAYRFHGTKTMGVNGSNETVYRIDESGTTDASAGTASHTDIVWDAYELVIDEATVGYNVKETSELLPLQIEPGETVDLVVTLVPYSQYTLQVTIINAAGDPVDNATANLTRNTYSEQEVGGATGQVFFRQLPEAGEYNLHVDAPGYAQSTQPINVDGNERVTVTLVAS